MDEMLTLLTGLEKDVNFKQLEQQLQKFNIFEAVGMTTQEIKHSHFLAFLLDPNQNHRLGNQFLLDILKIIGIETSKLSPDFKTTVRREWTPKTRRVDILILIEDQNSKIAVVIENKIHSGEIPGQLQEYKKLISQYLPEYQETKFVLLSPDERSPSDVDYITLGYKTIAKLLKPFSESGSDVSLLISHYISMLTWKRHVMDSPEVIELCRSIWNEHSEALRLLIRHNPETRIRKEVTAYLLDLLKLCSEEIELDQYDNRDIRFIPRHWDEIKVLSNLKPELQKNKIWTTSGRLILFQFDNQASKDLTLSLYIAPGYDLITKEILNTALEYHAIFESMPASQTTRWKYIYTQTFIGYDAIIEAINIQDLKPIIDEQWQIFIEANLPKISDAIVNKIPWAKLEA